MAYYCILLTRFNRVVKIVLAVSAILPLLYYYIRSGVFIYLVSIDTINMIVRLRVFVFSRNAESNGIINTAAL